jgi:hypothetical protein
MVPPLAPSITLHVTAGFERPCTVAVNWLLAPIATETAAGLIAIVAGTGVPASPSGFPASGVLPPVAPLLPPLELELEVERAPVPEEQASRRTRRAATASREG